MHDHTGNFSTAIDGVNTPELDQADNDYAVGLLVQQIANSQYKNNTLIFVIEDDSQDGADHVDSHRRLVDPGLLDSVGYRRLGLLVLGVEMAKSSGQSTACGVVSDRVVDDTAKPDRPGREGKWAFVECAENTGVREFECCAPGDGPGLEGRERQPEEKCSSQD
jgi:hypothetical protein